MGAYLFDWLSLDNVVPTDVGNHAIEILLRDHALLKDLFTEFEKAEGRVAKRKIASRVLEELKAHAVIEEEIFYPAVRKSVGKDIMNEADEEHHVAKLLIAELEKMDGRGDHYDAKFTVLAENVRHHIKEEESEMLPKAQDLDLDFQKLGREMLDRKKQFLAKSASRRGKRTA